MDSPNDLHAVLDRLASGIHTVSDWECLRRAVQSTNQPDIFQIGGYNVYIQEGHDVQIGPRIYQGVEAQAIQKALRSALAEMFPFSSHLRPADVLALVEEHTRNSIRCVQRLPNLRRPIQGELEAWISSRESGFAVVVGEAGVGKSHLLCEMTEAFLNDPRYAVLFFRSEDFLGMEFYEAILNALGLAGRSISLDDLLRVLRQELGRRVVFFVDALDLVAFNHGATKLRRLVQTLQKCHAVLVAASRPQEYSEFTEIVHEKFSLPPLSESEVRMLLAALDISPSILDMILHSEKLIAICRNPLHLEMLLSNIDGFRDIRSDLRLQDLYDVYWIKKIAGLRPGVQPPAGIQRDSLCRAKQMITKKIARVMLQKRRLSLRTGEAEIFAVIDPPHKAAYADLISEGVMHATKGEVAFFHQSFWEYCAARTLIEDGGIKDVLDNASYPLYQGVLVQLGIQAHSCGRTRIFTNLMNTLKKKPFLSKVALVDILVLLEDLSEKETEALHRLVREDYRLVDHILGLIIYEGGRHSFSKLFGLVDDFCRDEHWEIRRRIAEALPNLIRVDPDRAIHVMEILRSDYDPSRWKTDVRRRVVEALPTLAAYSTEKALDLAKHQPDDEVFTVLASVEFLADLPKDSQSAGRQLLNEILDQLPPEEAAKVGFLNGLLCLIQSSPEQAMRVVQENLDHPDPLMRVILCRSLPRLLPCYPTEVLDFLYHYARTEEHKNVRRPVAKAASEIIRYLEMNPDQNIREQVENIIMRLARDEDDIIRRALSDNLDHLIEIDPSFVLKLIEEHLANDENFFVRMRAGKLILRLINFFPERRETLLSLVESTR